MIKITQEQLEVGRRAIEDTLVEYRDNRVAILDGGNGFVIRERDGSQSSVMRFGTITGLRIALKAMGFEVE